MLISNFSDINIYVYSKAFSLIYFFGWWCLNFTVPHLSFGTNTYYNCFYFNIGVFGEGFSLSSGHLNYTLGIYENDADYSYFYW